MKPLSERIKDFPADQFVDWLCLSCVDVREVRNEEDAQDEINKIRKAVTERLTALEKQREALAAENAALKDSVALLLEDARRIMQVEPNAGTESRINHALSLLNRAGKDGE